MIHTDDRPENDSENVSETVDEVISEDSSNHPETDFDESLNDTPKDESFEDADELADEPAERAKKTHKKYGKFALGFTALSALIIGGASGGGFVQYVMGPLSSHSSLPEAIDLAPLKTQITQLAATNTNLADENARLETRLSNLDSAFEALQASVEDAAQNIQTPEVQVVDVSGLKSRLDALEGAPKPTPINEAVLGRLETLQASGSPALDLSAIEARLAELETASTADNLPEATSKRLQTLYEQQAEAEVKLEGQIAGLSDDLQSVEDDLSDAQTRLAELSGSQVITSEEGLGLKTVQAAGLPFPKQALLDALAAQTQKKPLLKRALSKHIKVKDPSAPAVIIDRIVADLEAGKLAAAAERFDSLPPEIRSAGSVWRDSLK